MSEFQSTLWTVIRGAGKGDEAALRDFVLKYRPPVLSYLARRGFRAEAEDLAQEVFLRIFQDRVLDKADPSRGRFRSLLLSVTRHVLSHHVERELAKKRQAPPAASEPATGADETFDREWVAHLIEVALARLAREHPNYHEALSAQLSGAAADYNHVARGKKKLAEYLRDQVRDYSASRAEFDEELRFLSRFFPSPAAKQPLCFAAAAKQSGCFAAGDKSGRGFRIGPLKEGFPCASPASRSCCSSRTRIPSTPSATPSAPARTPS